MTQVRQVADPAGGGAGAGPEGDTTLDGGAETASQDGRDFGERVRRGGVAGHAEPPGDPSNRVDWPMSWAYAPRTSLTRPAGSSIGGGP